MMEIKSAKHFGFEPLYLGGKLHTVNPLGRAGIVTFWSKADVVRSMLNERGVDLSSDRSAIAVIANLYGDGLPQMLANLLYNPQIDSLVLLGRNLSDSKDALLNFFSVGVSEPDLRFGTVTIQGTTRRLPLLLNPLLFQRPLRILDLGEDLRTWNRNELESFLLEGVSGAEPDRIQITLPEIKVSARPSNLCNHSVTAPTPCEAWRETLFVLSEFGQANDDDTSGGDRRELLNIRVVIDRPVEEPGEVLRQYNLDPAQLQEYQEKMFEAVCPPDLDYTYGARLGSHFGINTLDECVRVLAQERGSRHAYVALWDTRLDLQGKEVPCLVSLFFRVFNGRLTLTATFRAHNAASAWIRNCYGLVAILNRVGSALNLPLGQLVMISESISLRKSELQNVLSVIDVYRKSYQQYREDANGHLQITIDDGRILVEQRSDGMVVNRFSGTSAQTIEYEIGKARAISEISHAMYVGRELSKAERCLKTGEPYSQS